MHAGKHLLVDELHVTPVGEEGEHRAAHGRVDVHEELGQGLAIAWVVGLGHVLAHHDRHVVLVVKARVEAEVTMGVRP